MDALGLQSHARCATRSEGCYGRTVAKRPRHQCTGDEGGKASTGRASRVTFLDDTGMICSAVDVGRSNLSRSHAGLRGTGTQGPARGATISRSTVHCQSKATSWLNQHQPGSLCAAIFIKGGIRETQYDPGHCGHVGKTGSVCSPRKPGRGLRSDRSRKGIGVPSTMTTSVESAARTAVGQTHLPLAQHRTTLDHQYRSDRTGLGSCRNRQRPVARRPAQNHCLSTVGPTMTWTDRL